MSNASEFLRKCRRAIKNPSVLRNIVYGKITYFPTGIVTHPDMRDVPIYCISLQRATKRRSFLEKQVKKAGFTNFHFVEAVDGSLLDMNQLKNDGSYNDALAREYHNRSLTLAEIAVALSHGRIYEKVLLEKHTMAMVLEDDALFVSKRINRINISDLPPDWDVVFLSSFLFDFPPKGHLKGCLYNTESWKGSAAAYLVSLKGASKLAEVYKPVIHASDGLLGRSMDYPSEHSFKQQGARTKIDAYLVYPDCILNGSVCGFYGTTI